MPQEKKYMTAEEASTYTKGKLPDRPEGYSAETIARAARKRMIPGAEKYGQAWMLPTDGIDVWLKSEIDHRPGRKT